MSPEPVKEYGVAMTDGGYHIRWLGVEPVYPLADWITHQRAAGGHVCRREVIVLSDWQEVTEP